MNPEKHTVFREAMILTVVSFMVIIITQSFAKAQPDDEWPGFHGPDRTNKSSETGLLKEWPEQGPELIMTITGLGEGYSSVSVADGYIFSAGVLENQTYVHAFDLNGNLLWKRFNGWYWETTMSWATTYTGSRSTPTYSDGVVYHLGELGRLAAWECKTGNEIWNIELKDQFGAEVPEYGYTESVIIDGNRLFCCPAGKNGYIICLDKRNGNLIWVNKEIQEPAGNSSLIIFDHGGNRQVAGMTAKSIFGVDAGTGKLLWKTDYKNDNENNITDPIFHEGYLFASSGYGKGSTMIKLNNQGNTIIPETVWQTEKMDNHHGGVILHEGKLYGSGQNARGWFCLDFMTGEEIWKSVGKGSLTFADGMLYLLDERGIMSLVTATPEKYDIVSKFEVPSGGKGMHWAHPVVCGGKLYIRHTDKIFVYDLREK